MTETDKYLHLYVRAIEPARLGTAMQDVVRRVRDWLFPALEDSVRSHNLMGAAYLLSHGVPADTGNGFLVESALVDPPFCNVEMAKLLRSHHAPMNHEALYKACEVSAGNLVDELVNPPSSGFYRRKPVPAYHFVRIDEDGPHMRVSQSWPPASMPATVPAEAYRLPDDVRGHLIVLWGHIGVLRRNEARQLRKYNWTRARLLVKMMAITFFWQEETQKRLCAPNGEGRAQDLEAFREAFDKSLCSYV